jgi:hypothetical protein
MTENRQFSGLTKRVNLLAELVLQNRIASALDAGAARYPIYRVVRFAARIELDVLRIGKRHRVRGPALEDGVCRRAQRNSKLHQPGLRPRFASAGRISSSTSSVPRMSASAAAAPMRSPVSARCRSSMPFTAPPSKRTTRSPGRRPAR